MKVFATQLKPLNFQTRITNTLYSCIKYIVRFAINFLLLEKQENKKKKQKFYQLQNKYFFK